MYVYIILLTILEFAITSYTLTIHTPTASGKSVTLEDYGGTLLPNRSICGRIIETPKIYGGTAAVLGEFPWTVALEYVSPTNKTTLNNCVGTLINKQFVLTSASCVSSKFAVPTNAILGEWRLSTDPDCTSTKECANPITKIKIQKVIAHEGFVSKNAENDIGLIRLDEDVTYTEFISPICLPPKNLPFPQEGDAVTVAGWGKTEQEKLSDILLKVELPITSSNDCAEKLRITISEKQFCAGGEENKDACQGDAGSSAIRVYNDDVNEPRWYQHGIVSSGGKCGRAGYPGTYTRVDKYVDWILTKIENIKNL